MSITKKLFLIMTIMAVLITAELTALTITIKVLSAVRSYVGGEGLWSKAQKNAIYYLTKYTYTHNEKDYQNYLDFLKIPLSDHQARIALSKNPIDYNGAKQGFAGGDIHPDDIDGIIWLFHRFNRFYYINKAITIWGQADDLLFKLIEQGDQLHQSIVTRQATSTNMVMQLEHIDQTNNELTRIENEFSYTLGEGSRWLENIIFKLLLSIALIVEFTGIILTTLIGIKISKSIKAMNKIAGKVAQSDFSERVTSSSNDELGQLAVSFNTMIDELDKHEKLKNEFISVLSHELRTPLTSIKGSLDLLTTDMMRDLSTLRPQTLLKLAKNNCERLVRLINDLLDVEKIESGHMEFLFKPIILNDLLNEAVMANQPYGEQFHVKVKLIQHQKQVIIDADHDRLIQVLSNLISNAIKFSPQGEEVTVSSAVHNNQVEVSVSDRGPGVPESFQAKIFKKFTQADSALSREHSGTGLGLSISKTIVEKHGGTIFFRANATKGTTFYFNLPITHRLKDNDISDIST